MVYDGHAGEIQTAVGYFLFLSSGETDGKHRTNEELGYRTAGSKAELATGEMLEQEMHTIGFPIIHKDAITVDAWEFERAK